MERRSIVVKHNKNELLKFEEFFSENGVEAIGAMTELMASQQQIAIGLTQLVLEYSEKKYTKDEIFKTFKDACDLLKQEINRED